MKCLFDKSSFGTTENLTLLIIGQNNQVTERIIDRHYVLVDQHCADWKVSMNNSIAKQASLYIRVH